MNKDMLLAKWVFHVLHSKFAEQHQAQTQKVFIKINGLSHHDIYALIRQINETADQLAQYYEPVIRTVKPIPNHRIYQMKEHETIVWLRNNIKSGQALVILINDQTPEAQSLENMFSIDEAHLLSDEGIENLLSVLAEEKHYVSEELELIRVFIHMYQKLVDPQLRFLLNFIVEVCNDEEYKAMSQKIQHQLPNLGLFKDPMLTLGTKGLQQLRSNFYLAHLTNGNSELDREKLLDNALRFIVQEERNGLVNELWKDRTPEQVERDVVDFLRDETKQLLSYQFETVEQIFNFRLKVTLKSQAQELIEAKLELPTVEQKSLIEDALVAIEKQDNAEIIEEFIEEFDKELSLQPKVLKGLKRLVQRINRPTHYQDFLQGFLTNAFTLLDSREDDTELTAAHFSLRISNKKVKTGYHALLRFYFGNLSFLMPRVSFDLKQLDTIVEDNEGDEVIVFSIELTDGEQKIESSFSFVGLSELTVASFFEKVNEGLLPYRRHYEDGTVEYDVPSLLREKLGIYGKTIHSDAFHHHYEQFTAFCHWYVGELQEAIKQGIGILDKEELENRVSSLLQGIYTAAPIPQEIYHKINWIGAIDSVPAKKEDNAYVTERIVSLLHPIRLLAYLHQLVRVNQLLEEWIQNIGNLHEIHNPDEYVAFVYDRIQLLAPQYMASEADEGFLVENHKNMGEGVFFLSSYGSSTNVHLMEELSEELLRTTRNYFEVYPAAKDGLSLLFLYCQSHEIVIKMVETIFLKMKELKKLTLTVHSTKAAQIHHKISEWVARKEEFSTPNLASYFPKIEIQIVPGGSINDVLGNLKDYKVNADIAILADYFGQTSNIHYEYEPIKPVEKVDWFSKVYKEPMNSGEVIKRIPYVSEYLPLVLQNFYQLQFMYSRKEMPRKNELYVMKNKISLSNFSDTNLLNFVHKSYNWVMILDRFVDKSLLENASTEAQIIQYKSKAGTNKQYRFILSSSKYVRRLLSSYKGDYEYYDRLKKKIEMVLKSSGITTETMVEAVNKVKAVSGGLVLKAIGPGKYTHEMIATYLSKKRQETLSEDGLVVWSVCDELPWFKSNRRRPDLVKTKINRENDQLHLEFEFIELKFVNSNIFNQERRDGIKQVEAGISLYSTLFNFEANHLESEYWKDELIHYLIEREAYTPQYVELLKQLQIAPAYTINVSIKGRVDCYCYTSNLLDLPYEEKEKGMYVDVIDKDIECFIYNRWYILQQLGVQEDQDSTFEYEDEFAQKSFSDVIKDEEEKEQEAQLGIATTDSKIKYDHQSQVDQYIQMVRYHLDEETLGKDQQEGLQLAGYPGQKIAVEDKKERTHDVPPSREYAEEVAVTKVHYPEIEALQGVEINGKPVDAQDHETVKRELIAKLDRYFMKYDLNLKIEENNVIIGPSVIRFVLKSDTNPLKKQGEQLQLLFGLDQEPRVFIDRHGLNLDINRNEPETFYFEDFMEEVRKKIGGALSSDHLYAPLGLDPLREAVILDFADSNTPHLLIAGATGSGKSVTMNSIIMSMMCLYDPSQVKFIFIDPKKVEFAIYEGMIHTQEVVTDIEEAIVTLENMVRLMEDRYALFQREGQNDIREYLSLGEEKLPRYVIVFDEFADFMMQDKQLAKRVENTIARLGQMARAAGIHLMICTQTPKAEVINTTIRNNLPARLSLRMTDTNGSQIMLDDVGAEVLPGKGDFLARIGAPNFIRGKSPFLQPQVKRALIKYFRNSL
ncbi:FtsK/SpoIIIE domain-containing protein [Aneurinibacillus aneurinilyticus]|uniref:FtsK/SpoIIIE domain-containing protein n=1 Tax=Aneurinibacillus aneurinilyticus TaxID=1391 RepID=UPI003525DB61